MPSSAPVGSPAEGGGETDERENVEKDHEGEFGIFEAHERTGDMIDGNIEDKYKNKEKKGRKGCGDYDFPCFPFSLLPFLPSSHTSTFRKKEEA